MTETETQLPISFLEHSSRRTPGNTVRPPPPARVLHHEPTPRLLLRAVVGYIFFAFGMLKFLSAYPLGVEGMQLAPGAAGFADFLTALGVPFPLLNAYVVILVEIIGGLGILLSALLRSPPRVALLTRLFALPLALDMLVATVIVGVRNALGQPVEMEGIAVSAQAWRLPVEFALMVASAYFVWRPLSTKR